MKFLLFCLLPFVAQCYTQNFPLEKDAFFPFQQRTVSALRHGLETLVAIPNEERTYENTILFLDEVGQDLLGQMAILKGIEWGINDPVIQECAEETIEATLSSLQSMPYMEVIETVLTFSEKQDALLPEERYRLIQLIESIPFYFFPEKMQQRGAMILDRLKSRPSQSFTFERGDRKRLFTLLTLNICMHHGDQSLIFGGVRSWSERIDRLLMLIESKDADVICLQEVFDRHGGEALYEGLKDFYSYFYLDIGPNHFGFNPETMGLSSGLFVASKYPLSEPQFIPYENDEPHMTRGFFSFKVVHHGDILGRVITTHLEPFDSLDTRSRRLSEIEQIIDFIQVEEGYPLILCGDLNIPLGNNEEAHRLAREHFYDTYSEQIEEVTFENRTYVDYTQYYFNETPFEPFPKLLDYILLARNDMEDFGVKTVVVQTNDLESPVEALSDHHGLFAEVIRK